MTLSSLLASKKPPTWVSNQQWALFLPGSRVAGSQAPSSTQLTEASSELQRAAFVGLVEQMDVALCRFAGGQFCRMGLEVGPREAAEADVHLLDEADEGRPLQLGRRLGQLRRGRRLLAGHPTPRQEQGPLLVRDPVWGFPSRQ